MTGLILILFAITVALGVPMAFGFGSATAIVLLAKSNLPLDLIPQRMALAVDSFVLLAILPVSGVRATDLSHPLSLAIRATISHHAAARAGGGRRLGIGLPRHPRRCDSP